MPTDPIKLDPEVENTLSRLLSGFGDRIEKRIERAEENTGRQIHTMSLQVDGLSRNVHNMQADITEVKREMKTQSATLSEHSTAIAVIMEKLEAGEERFEKNERELEKTDEALVALLKRPQNSGGVNYRQLATGLAAGASIAAAMARLWH